MSAERVLAGIPIAIAAFVGLLYGVGALLSAARFRGAGLSIQDTLPLLPLETILARGIGTLVASTLLVAAWVGVGTAAVVAVRRLKAGDARRTILLAALGLLGIALILVLTPVVIATVVLLGLVVYFGSRRGLRLTLVFSIAYAIALAGFVLSAFVYPTPLPVAHVAPDGDGPPIIGDLVVEDGGVWYVADFDTDEIQGFNLLNVEAAGFVSRDRDPRPTIIGLFD